MGWEGVTDGGLENPEPLENEVGRIVREVPGIDAVLMAHTHRVEPARRENGTLVLQAGSGGEAVGELRLSWNRNGELHVEGRVLEVGEATPVCSVVREIAEPAERRAAERTSEVLGTAEGAFRIEGLRYRDNAMLTLLHKVQLEESSADLSSAALFRAEEGLDAGPVRVLDLFRIYPFENSLMVFELEVDDIRDYLEQIAMVYLGPALGGEPPPLHPEISLYNHDSIAGCEYVIDPARPHGRRVTHLAFRGRELPGDRKVTLSLTSYRAQGGGGYRALRRGRTVFSTRREVRWLIGDYISRHERIRPEVFDNWRVEGVALGDARVSGALS
jgi:2',3'-cyclic-nucleotide 2'-phosphodiesterase/3'-nucleotidase